LADFKDIDWQGLDIDLDNIKSVEELEEALKKLRQEAGDRASEAFKKVEKTTDGAKKGFEGLGKDVKGAKESLEEFNEESRRTEDFENKVKQFLGMAGAVELFRRALRSAFETTKELDAAMTEMAVVTELDVGDYWD
jgi:phage-related tail protein